MTNRTARELVWGLLASTALASSAFAQTSPTPPPLAEPAPADPADKPSQQVGDSDGDILRRRKRARMTAKSWIVAARAEIDRMKHDVIELMHAHGGAHLQIGKVYPLLPGRNAASVTLLRAIKAVLDPQDILSPGALGL